MLPLTNRWAVLALLVLVRIGFGFQFQAIPPIEALLIPELGLDYTQVGLLIGLFMFPGLFIALPGGLLSGRFGDRLPVLCGLALMTAGAVLFASAHGFAGAAAGRLLGGMGMVLLNVLLTRIVADWFAGRELATAMGLLVSAWPLGIALALSSLGLIATQYSWRSAVLVTAAYTALALAGVALLYRERPLPGGRRPDDSGESGTSAARLWSISGRELALTLAAGTIWLLFNAGFIVYLAFAPALLAERGLSVAAAGFTVSLASWVSIASIPLGGWLADRTGRGGSVIAAGALLAALTMGLTPLGGPAALWAVLLGIAFGAPNGAIMALPGRVLSPAGRNTGFGVYYTVFYVGMAGIMPLAGLLRDLTGSAASSVGFAALVMVSTLPALLLFHRMNREQRSP